MSREAAINDVYTERSYGRHGSSKKVLDPFEACTGATPDAEVHAIAT